MRSALVRRVLAPFACVLALFAGCSESDSGPARAKGPVTPVDAATAGSIAVQVSYDGPVPVPKEINMRSTPACASLHTAPVLDQRVLVTDGRLANAVVYIKSGLGERSFAIPTSPVVIDQKGCLYTPRVAAVMAGQTLQFRNSDQEAHNVHGRPTTLDGWNFLMSRPGSTRDLVFERAELGVPVGCDIHPWMQAYVSVFDSPYFGVTPADGRVTLQTVPPGDYVVGVWHETLGTLEQPVSLPAQGRAQVDFTFRPKAG